MAALLPFPLTEEPDDFSREAGRLLLTSQVEFLKGVVALAGLPPADRVEVCFAGRSNVGKSSLINALTGRRALARASNTHATKSPSPNRARIVSRMSGNAAQYAR